MKKSLLPLTLFSLLPLFSDADIQLQTCYGNSHTVIVEGRVLEERTFSESHAEDSWLKNTWKKVKQLVNHEVKNEKLSLVIGGEVYENVTDNEGYFEFEINNSNAPWKNHENIEIYLDELNVSIHASAFIIDASIKRGVISDFDDTVVVSGVTSKLELVKNTFFKNYKQRELVNGMKEHFSTILNTKNTPLFFVTGSPKQLYGAIHRFLNYHGFPKRTLITKKAHGDNADPLFDQLSYKVEKIEKLIELFPQIKWVCFGDSGEKDAEVYSKLLKEHPKQIKAIYIRNVDSGKIEQIFP
jgi:phosphatidate phosphatase APP1